MTGALKTSSANSTPDLSGVEFCHKRGRNSRCPHR